MGKMDKVVKKILSQEITIRRMKSVESKPCEDLLWPTNMND